MHRQQLLDPRDSSSFCHNDLLSWSRLLQPSNAVVGKWRVWQQWWAALLLAAHALPHILLQQGRLPHCMPV